MKAPPSPQHDDASAAEQLLQLLLFVDKRPQSSERIRQIRQYLKQRSDSDRCELQVIDIGDQPHLAEHFRLVATPALIKASPAPQQTLTGANLVEQLEAWWPRWLRAIEDIAEEQAQRQDSASITNDAELIRLSDEIFRISQEKIDLEAQLQFKDRLIAMLAHDLRNPLTALSIALETLEMGFDSGSGESHLKPELQAQILHHGR
ncbi:MAG: circadian clock KaiB family protein, partial [Cyanobacteria bacterium P01_A01_bin.135]